MSDYGSIKREAPDDHVDDCEGPTKRARSGGRAVDVRFLVKSKNAGAIIGKGGSNINRLRTDFKASVTVPDCSGPERILSVVADTDTLGDILLDVLPKLDDYSHHDNMEFDCELRMLLHQSHAGCLIGKGGSRIKELREKTGAQIKIFSNCCPNSTERVVLITGVPKIVVSCVKEVCDVISQAPIKGPNKPYDPHHFDPMFASEYGGYEDTMRRGKGRGSFRGRPPPPAWRDDIVDNFSFGHDMGNNRGSGFSSQFAGRGRAGLMGPSPGGGRWGQEGPGGGSGLLDRPGWGDEVSNGFGPLSNNRGRMLNSVNGGSGLMGQGMGDKMLGGPRTPLLPNSGMGGYQGSSSPGLNGPSPRFMGSRQGGYIAPVPGTGELFSAKPMSNASGSASVRMKIPNDVAGAIIGKGGQRIRKIRRDSAAAINIEESTSGSNDRIITITGSMSEVSSAQFLMQQSVHENPPNRSRY